MTAVPMLCAVACTPSPKIDDHDVEDVGIVFDQDSEALEVVEDIVGDDGTSGGCFGDAPGPFEPGHVLVSIRVEALRGDRRIDSISAFDGGRDMCVAHSGYIFDSTYEDERIYELEGEPDGVSDDGRECITDLGAHFPNPGDGILLSVAALVGPGDVIEVRDAAGCEDQSAMPALEIGITPYRRLDEPYAVLGTMSGSIGRFTVEPEMLQGW